MTTFKNRNFPLYSLFCVLFCCRFVWSQLSSTQRTSMNNLSETLNNSALHWDVNKEPCSWKGIKCNPSNTSVTEISLSGYSISSSLFLPRVCEIDSLQAFDVSNNLLSQIPDEFMTGCGKVGGLRSLNFSRNMLVGLLPKFVGFVGLEILDLSFNFLSGNIGLEFEGLDSLISLNLSGNKFNGSVPTQLGKSMALKEFVLSFNKFSGKIPEEIIAYRNLTLIDLSQNSLSGSIPNRIGDLSKLTVLILSSNYLDGEIPNGLSTITTLWRFAANQNNFSGVIPSEITQYLRNFDLSYNNLTGSIPSDLLSRPKLQTVDLSFNSLEGPVPDNISLSLIRLRLGSNTLDGEIPSAGFLRLEKLTYLELDNNNLSGLVPPGLGKCKSLALLNLAQNHLTGPVPLQLGNLSHLQVLKLQINDLSGEIPIQITQLQKLSVLNISWNSLTGPIPPSISSLKVLINLNLGGNHLNGSIPDTISSIDSLLELQLGENRLSGVIPKMPPNLQIALNLSHNLFEGPIPKVLSELRSLEVLDLSNNNFSGEIPEFLTSMGSLNWLLLSNNSLSGVIPTYRPWAVVDTSGNTGLINATKSEPSSRSGKRNFVIIIVIAVVIPIVAGTIIAISVSWYYDKKNCPNGNLLTKKMIHRSNIDFTKAMKAVSLPSNVVQTTRFSTYYKAIMPSGTTYFIKKLSGGDKLFQLPCRERFHKELEFLGSLSNSNVMTPLAYVLTVKKAFLLYEFAPSGTLFDALHASSGSGMDWACRYSVAVGIARALTFLHGLASGPMLLLDLSSRLIFLKSLREPLIGDIELYKVIDPSKTTGNLTTLAGSVGYIPPEYAYTMRVTPAGNVYSFGVVLLELLTGKPAVSAGTNLAKWVLNDLESRNRPEDILDPTISIASDAVHSQMLGVLKVAVGCVAELPEDRPVMNSILQMLLDAE